MSKTVFLAGASGAIGRRLAPLLISEGWRVFGTTRSADKAALLRGLDVEPVIVDVFVHRLSPRRSRRRGPRSSSTN
jgi:uncharacterized protein YbjT (DUF2867 family)